MQFLFLIPLLGGSAPLVSVQADLRVEASGTRPWEHESSDLPVDPALRFGALANGVRFAWANNPEPKLRSYLRLHVDAGSLAEEESERGMAHFLEHMAFNGSEHFAAGTLVEWFQRHGMGFGADLNAHTDFSETVYKLDLPESDEKTLDEGLLVLRDFASGLLLEEKEIEAEKGVVDGEERERDSPGYRVFVRQLQTLFGSTRLDERIPIGVRETRHAFTSASVRAFYSRWYRPEHMTIVLVGDLGKLDPVPLFEKHFGSLARPEEPLQNEPPAGALGSFPKRACFFEPEIPAVSLFVQRIRPWVDEAYTAERWQKDLPLSTARRMLDLRYEELVKEPSAPFLGADLAEGEALRVIDGEALTIRCTSERWREALALCEQELRRAIEHGFQDAELAEVRSTTLRELDEAVEREPTRASAGLVGELLHAAEDRYVPTSAKTDRDLVKPVVDKLTTADCQKALAEAWSQGELTLFTVGNLDLGPDAAKTLDEAYSASRAVAVEKRADKEAKAFAYSASEEAAPVAERRTVEDLDFVAVRFANGVTLDVKRTDFKEKQVLFNAALGEGQLSLEPSDTSLALLADRVFVAGGLEAHSIDELRRLTAGKEVSTDFSVGEESFSFGGATTAEDLLLQFELLCAFLEAPGWREDGWVQFFRGLPLLYEGLRHQHQGPIVMEFLPQLFAGDPRFSFPTQADLEGRSLANVRAWLTPFLADAPLEISVVGDLDIEDTIRFAARTVGKLPARRELRAYDEHRRAPAPKSGLSQQHEIDTEVQKSLVLLAFPLPDGIDADRRRRLEFLGAVVNDRLRVEVRERLGASYSPGANVDVSRFLPGVGMLLVQALTEPAGAETLRAACLGVTDALAEKGVEPDEVARLREPMLKGLRDAQRRNGYWLGALSVAQRRPASLDEVREQAAALEKIDAAAISALAKEHLPREHVSMAVVQPRAAKAGDAAEAEKPGD